MEPAPKFDLKPYHLAWAGAALFGLFALLTLGNGVSTETTYDSITYEREESTNLLSQLVFIALWLGAAAACVHFARKLRADRTLWPDAMHAFLVENRLAAQVPTFTEADAESDRIVYLGDVVPVRPLGFVELLSAAVAVMKRNPRITLVLPAIVISTCIAGIMFLVQLVFTVIVSDAFSVDALLTAFVTTLLIVTAVALPMDAFIAAVTVVGADRAIRGEQAKIGPVVSNALSRMSALIKLMLVFYAIFLLPYILIVPMSMIVTSGGAETLLILPSFALIAVEFVAGVLLSLAPIVMVIEKTGLVDTFKRTYSLTRPALGRLLGIHLLWFVVVVPISIVTMIIGMMVHWIAMIVVLAIGISFFRILQTLIYHDVRVRQVGYAEEVLAEREAVRIAAQVQRD